MKIKNENDMLGVLISRMDSNNDIDNVVLMEDLSKFKFDRYSANVLMNELNRKHFIIKTLDTTTVTMLGINNYVSKWDKIRSWLILLVKFAVSYTLGILSGVIMAFLIFKLGIG